nr:uncharacterized protein LOC128681152 [Plodia interpunctella]
MAKSALSIILFILNIVYVILGVILGYFSVSYYIELQLIKQIRTSDLYIISTGLKWPEIVPYIFFGVAVFVLLVSLCGFVGVYTRPVLIVYVVFLLVAVGVSTSASAVVYSYADNTHTDEFIGKIIENGIAEVRVAEIEAGNTTAFGMIEERYRCCGDKDARYYLTLTRWEIYPKSCCGSDQPCSGRYGNAKVAQTRLGCRKVVTYKTRNSIYYLWVGCACVSVSGLINLIVAIVAVTLKTRKPRLNVNNVNVTSDILQETQTLRINGTSNSVSV